MRKYFTEADQRVIPINSVFGFTAIQQPFMNADLLQRAILLEFDKNVAELKSGDFTFNSFWKEEQISKRGGRAAWIAHHMHVLHLFFRKVHEKWDNNYRSKHRLVGFEQSLMLMAEVFGMNSDWIPDYLMNSSNSTVGRSDWTLEGLIQWTDYCRRSKFAKTKLYSVTDISNWAQNDEDFDKNFTLTNTRALGRYLATNKHNLLVIVGLEEAHKVNNKMTYRVLDAPLSFDERPNEAILPT